MSRRPRRIKEPPLRKWQVVACTLLWAVFAVAGWFRILTGDLTGGGSPTVRDVVGDICVIGFALASGVVALSLICSPPARRRLTERARKMWREAR